MAGVELGTGYISIVASTDGIPAQLRRALSGAGGIGEAAGRDMGGKMSSALGGALKGGAVAAGAVVAGVLGTAITKGIGRLTAIDDAQGKLAGLGHSAASTAKIMDSALASVKGTAFGLGDAATIAASAVAAGIKPGEELTKYLSMIGDAATIGGASLSEMGSIINQTTTSGIVFTDTLNQLADRGIPIFTWLQDEYKVSGAELRNMVEEGEVDAATFQSVIEKNIGGAALAGGETVRGAFANMGAALGRFGAVVAGPVFSRAAGGFGGLTEAIDGATAAITPFVDKFDAWLGSEGIPKAQEFGQAVADAWGQFSSSGLVTDSISQISDIFGDLLDVGRELAPAVTGIAGALGQAAAAIGISSWQLLLNTLDAIAPILDATLVPALEQVSSLLQDNQGAALALVGGFALFETVPGIVDEIRGPFEEITGQISGAIDSVRNFGSGLQSTATVAGYGQVQMGRFGSAVQRIGQHVPIVGAMQHSFLNAAAGAERFGRSAGFAAAASTGLKAAASGVANMFGGPLIAGIGAAILIGTQMIGALDDVSNAQESAEKSSLKLAEAQDVVAEAFGKSAGAINDEVMSSLTDQVDTFRNTLEQTAADAPGFWTDVLEGFGYSEKGGNVTDQLQEAGRIAGETSSALDKLGYSNSELAERIAGTQGNWDAFVGQLREIGGASDEVVAALQKQRDEFLQQQKAAKNVTPGIIELAASIEVLSDTSATADKKASALKDALNALLGIPVPLAEAMSDYEETIADIAAASTEAAAASGGLGAALFDSNGGLNLQQANARALQEEILGLRDDFVAAATAGGDVDQMAQRNQVAFEGLAAKYRLTSDEVQRIAEQYGLVPELVETLIRLNGADSVDGELAGIALRLNEIDPDQPKTVTVLGLTEDAEKKLTDLGFTVTHMPNGEVKIEALTDAARAAILDLTKPETKEIRVRANWDPDARAAYFGSPDIQGPVPIGRALGGPITGGIPGADSVPIMAMPGEHMLTVSDVQRLGGQDGVYRFRAALQAGLVPGYANGGAIQAAMNAAYAGTGKKYLWGGTGPSGWDCSGWVGYLQQILMGVDPSSAAGRRLYTTYSLLGGSTAGLEPGSGPAGTVFVVGTSDEHMAATLNGQPVESGGAHGTSRIGSPAVGAFDSQFHSLFHLPNELIDGGVDPTSLGALAASEREPWTEKDQLDLESARISVQQAKEDRDKTYANEKKSDADKAQADLKVQRAELKVRELENKRDGVGVETISTEPAPPLTGEMGDSAIQVRQAEIAVLDAQLSRDKVYNDPKSTTLDKEKADLQVFSAKNSLEETKKRIAEEGDGTNGSGSKSGSGSIKDRIKQYGADMFGIFVDAVTEQLFPFGEPRILNAELPSFDAPKKGDTVADSDGKKKGDKKRVLPLADIPATFPDINKQLGFNPEQPPAWIEQFLKKAPKVFDSGGWLMPGEMGINLSSKPEPIFNSPKQLLQFAGAHLDSLQPAAPSTVDNSIQIIKPQFANESKMMRSARDAQERRAMQHEGRPF